MQTKMVRVLVYRGSDSETFKKAQLLKLLDNPAYDDYCLMVDGDDLDVEIFGLRPETEEEKNAREQARIAMVAQDKEFRRKSYEILKAEFEPKG